MTDLKRTIMILNRRPMMRPRSTSMRTVEMNVTIQRVPSQRDLDQYCVTSASFLTIPERDARMIEARTQTGRGSKMGARDKMTASRVRLEVRPVSRVSQPDLSWTRDRDSEADMGTQLRNEPRTLLTPWATHSGLGGTL